MTMPVPPFKRARPPADRASLAVFDAPSEEPSAIEAAAPSARRRLTDLDGHLHCSVIGTCHGTGELRRLMARHVDVADADDLVVHHEAVRFISEHGAVAKALQKALDHKHDAAIRQAARVRGEAALTTLWKEALRAGEVPGMYWAVLTHRDANAELTKVAFGDVHMLSHLVGSANRADLRRLVALENENASLRTALDTIQERLLASAADRDREVAALEARLITARQAAAAPTVDDGAIDALRAAAGTAVEEAALQRDRCEHWERVARETLAEAARSREAQAARKAQVDVLEREVTILEALVERGASVALPVADQLRGRRILYVGGRPASTEAIRDLVVGHGGEFRSHDGGLEDRKGLLAPAVATADLVLFPVDCIDHDSAGAIKRLCSRNQVPFVPLRSAGIASFTAALIDRQARIAN